MARSGTRKWKGRLEAEPCFLCSMTSFACPLLGAEGLLSFEVIRMALRGCLHAPCSIVFGTQPSDVLCIVFSNVRSINMRA